jgi:hypothetical protein
MSRLIVYSFKVEREKLEHAKKFFARQGVALQDSLRDLIDVAAECEECLVLEEEGAPTSELQSAFASLLAAAKNAGHLNGLLREAVLKIAKICEVPVDFIMNVLGEARRIKPAFVRRTKT